MQKNIKILAIETSCDETAASVVEEREGEPVILSNIVSSQIDLHAQTGGVVPEVASRAHLEAIIPVITRALLTQDQELDDECIDSKLLDAKPSTLNYQRAISLFSDITHIAVTAGPGLIGSLLVGFNAAKTIAYAKNLTIIPINHIEGHIYSALSRMNSLEYSVQGEEVKTLNTKHSTLNNTEFPILALTVSGGHTSLTLMKDHGYYQTIGSTLDDAVGEAYDKVAQLLGLGYPGGPIISKLASQFRELSVKSIESSDKALNTKPCTINISFPRPIINDGTFDFSFSGLKTAVLVYVKSYLEKNNLASVERIPLETKEEIAAAFEEAVRDVLVTKTKNAVNKFNSKTVIFAGGVSANEFLRNSLKQELGDLGVKFLTPQTGLYGDNAAMIGLAAFWHIKRGEKGSWQEAKVDSNMEL